MMSARISLAGRIAVEVGDRCVDERSLPGAQARLVLALLTCERDRAVTRDELAMNLWPTSPPSTWDTALRVIVGRVRGFLVSAGIGDRGVVRAEAGAYHLRLPASTVVDLDHAESEAQRAERALADGQPHTAGNSAARARAVLCRPLLPGLEAPWLDGKRRQLSSLLLHTLETLAHAHLALGAPDRAAAIAEEAVALDGYRESAHRMLIRAHADAGNAAMALRAYERCRQLLVNELGVDPDPETQALHSVLLQGGAASLAEPAPRLRSAPTTPDVCPYRGLRTFQEGDGHLFFGRSADISRLLDRVQDQSFLAVVGPSGSGKSSLVRAGLVGALKRGGLPGSDAWPVRVLRPGAVPVKSLADELGRLDGSLDVTAAEQRMLSDARALHEIVAATGTARTVLVVDQLEEVFSLCDNGEQRRALLDNLVAAAMTPHSRVLVVVTFRADFYPRLAEHPHLADLVSSRQLLVTPMDEVGLAEAITGPARVAGVRLADGLVETILADVARQPGSLPLLSHCLLELWERRTDGRELHADTTGPPVARRTPTLTLGAYRETGGVHGALAQRAESVYQGLSLAERATARRTLLRLTQPGDQSEDTRRRATFTELLGHADEREVVEAVVNRLIEARLLTAGGPPGKDCWIEFAHEALIRSWPRLHAWIGRDRAGMRVHRRLSGAAAEWERLGRDDGALYRGAQLAEASVWAEDHPGESSRLEKEFLDASVALQTADRRRRLRRLRLVAAALATSLVVVSGLAVTALVLRERAESQHQLAQSRALAAEATGQLALEPALGLALAVEAVEVARTREAVAALRQALVTPRPQLEVPGGRDFTADPDGRYVSVGSADGAARVWDLRSGTLVHTLTGHDGPVYVTSFSPDGRQLLTTDDQAAHIWSMADGSRRHTLPHDATVFAASWMPGGERLITTTGTDLLRVWDLVVGNEVATLKAPGPVTFIQLTPDGRTALTWSATDPELFVLDTVTGEQRAVLEGHDAAAVEARIAPDGQHAVSVGLDATARLWHLATGEQLSMLDGFTDVVWIGRFSEDSALVLVGDGAGAIRVADVPGGRTRFERHAHAGAIVGAAFSPDGAVAATVSTDGSAQVWDVESGVPRGRLTLNGGPTLGVEARSVLFTPDGAHLLTRAATVQTWAVPPGPAMSLEGHTGAVGALDVSRDGATLATGATDGTLRLWALTDGELIHTLEVPDAAISAVAFSADGDAVVAANPAVSTAAEVTTPPSTWDVATGRALGSLAVPSPVKAPCPRVCQTGWAAYSPDGSELVTAGQEGVVRVWDASTRELRRTLQPTEQELRAAVTSPDGRWVAAAAWQSVPLWEASSGELMTELEAPGLTVAFDPAGDLLAVGGDDGIASLWDPEAARLMGELRHTSSVTDLAWSQDGRLLLTAAGDGARLWDVASQQQIQAFTGHGSARAVAFTPGDDIVTATASGTVHLHRCTVCRSVDDLLDDARAQSTRQLTPLERERFLRAPADRRR